MNIDQTIKEIQRHLEIDADGKAGPQTWGAIHAAIVGSSTSADIEAAGDSIILSGTPVDTRSEANIATLHPKVKPYARALVNSAAAKGIIVKVISGLRSFEEQAKLFEIHLQGGPLAAPPGRSNHNYGLAFDIGVFTGSLDPEQAKKCLSESPDYDRVGSLADDIGLTWGGNWTPQSRDKPHYELRPDWAEDLSEGEMLDRLIARAKSDEDAFA
jgi:peptidoglycan L-alanyl-D-glutamate endopeptidase CwlK